MTRRSARRTRWALGASLGVAVAVAIVLGASPAGAEPSTPAGPRAPHELAAPADPAPGQCSWVVDKMEGGSITYKLQCPDGVPEPPTKNELPPVPAASCKLIEVRSFPWLYTHWVRMSSTSSAARCRSARPRA